MAGSPLPEFWQRSWVAAQSRLEEWDKSLENFLGPSSRVLRVAQWDAELLDEDLVQLLKEPVVRALALLDVRNKFLATIFYAECVIVDSEKQTRT